METSTNDTDRFRLTGLRVAPAHTDAEDTQLKDELVSVLLHDLRSPLGAISVLTDLISAIARKGEPTDARQVQLLQDATTRAQRVLDDALEIQSVIRGSSTYNPGNVDANELIRDVIEKACRAPYLRSGRIEFEGDAPGAPQVRVDVDKFESAMLCLMEHVASRFGQQPHLVLGLKVMPSEVIIRIENVSPQDPETPWHPGPGRGSLRGRLGTRRPGESRYSVQICHKVLTQMGGRIDPENGNYAITEIHLPRVSR